MGKHEFDLPRPFLPQSFPYQKGTGLETLTPDDWISTPSDFWVFPEFDPTQGKDVAVMSNFLHSRLWIPGRSVVLSSILGLLMVAVLSGCLPRRSGETMANEGQIRAVWVSVLGPGFQTPEEIDQLVDAVRRANLNVIVAQVRRRGAVCFQSEIEPRHPVTSDDPGFDPLAVLLEKAHDTSGGKQRLDVHAWFNVYKIDDQSDLLESPIRPLSITHPEWFTRNAAGETQPALDPALSEVQLHVLDVIAECLRNYDVDGVNLDFVRYYGADMGYHPRAIERFHKQYNRTDTPAADDPQWSDFRRQQITDFVTQCALRVWSIRPSAIFSTDVVGFGPPKEKFSDTRPYIEVYQDWAGWAELGIVDWVARMGYKREWVPEQAVDYRSWADFSLDLQNRTGRFITLGIGGHFNPLEDVLTQYREANARAMGTCLFSYNRPNKEATDGGPSGYESPLWDRIGNDIYPAPAAPSRPEWRRNRATVWGIALDLNGKPLEGASVTLEGADRVTQTAATGVFAFTDLTPGHYRLSIPSSPLDGISVEAMPGKISAIQTP